MNSENRNIRLCSLRGTLFNKGFDDDEIREMLLAANEEFERAAAAGLPGVHGPEAQAGLGAAPGETARLDPEAARRPAR